jgi:pyruvate/2-oxoglutarate dehydrogenase complex dihydrolipoamide acyltransferase (E2) component
MSSVEMTLSEWMYADGDTVEAGEVIYTIETDKTTTEIEAPEGGILRVIGVEGVTYPIGTLVGTIE